MSAPVILALWFGCLCALVFGLDASDGEVGSFGSIHLYLGEKKERPGGGSE